MYGIGRTIRARLGRTKHEAVGGSYRLRVAMMALATVLFLRDVTRLHLFLLRRDGQLGNVKSAARFLARFWGPRGHFTRLVPAYLDYYRPGFHPWQHDARPAMARWKDAVEARAKRRGPVARSAA